MEEIVQIVRSCGYDFEGMPETSDNHLKIAEMLDQNVNHPASAEVGDETTRDIGHENTRPELASPVKFVPNKKRKREPGQATRMENPSNGAAKDASCALERTPFNQQIGIETGPKKEKHAATSLRDSYWDLDYYWDSILLNQNDYQASGSLPELALDQSAPPYVCEAFEPNFSPSPSKAQNSTSLRQSQALQASDHDTQPADIEWPDTDHVFDSARSYPMNIEDADDWGSTVWWDPSHLFDFDIDDSGLQSSVT
ncbi:hypothetical protein P7C71_g3294, partial [Lecanoromycetidae sp. Uapishka_2]